MRAVIAWDLDETMMTPVIDARGAIIGANVRAGVVEILTLLKPKFDLCVWSSGDRAYVEKMLALSGLRHYFGRVIAWEDYKRIDKDIRDFGVNYLVDDNEDLSTFSKREGLEFFYIIVPSMYSPDEASWREIVSRRLGL